MDKLTMAHEWLLVRLTTNNPKTLDELIKISWHYADAMQAEADKRDKTEAAEKRKAVRDMLNDNGTFVEREGQHFDDVATLCNTYTSSEYWQPDWSVAPDGANYWFKDEQDIYWWSRLEPYFLYAQVSKIIINNSNTIADSFNYKGDWKDSLRERPQQEPKQYACNCAHWKNSSFFMGDTFTCKDCGGSVTI